MKLFDLGVRRRGEGAALESGSAGIPLGQGCKPAFGRRVRSA
jgi:hypothetical protein